MIATLLTRFVRVNLVSYWEDCILLTLQTVLNLNKEYESIQVDENEIIFTQ